MALLPGLLAAAWCLALGYAGTTAASGSAQTVPSPGELESAIASNLPGYWRIGALSLTEPVNYGNQVEPDWRWRFEARVAPREVLYTEGERRGALIVLETGIGPDVEYTLYGIARATFHAGRWNAEITHENRPFEHAGQPVSYFPGRTVLSGSDEDRTLRERAQARSFEGLEARYEAERKALRVEHEAALARGKETHRTTLEKMEQGHTNEREQREAEHRLALEQARTRHLEGLAELEFEHEAALALAKETHRTTLEKMEQDHTNEREKREAEHRLVLEEARIRQREGLAELEARARQAAADIANSHKLEEVVAEATKRVDALHDAEAKLLAATEELATDRRTALAELVGRIDAAQIAEEYVALVDAAREGGVEWMHLTVLREGLGAESAEVREAAWGELVRGTARGEAKIAAMLRESLDRTEDAPQLKTLIERHGLPLSRQWASRVVRASLDRSTHVAPKWALGEPVGVGCNGRDNRTHWVPASQDDGLHSIRVAFDEPVLFPQIEVHEVSTPGFVSRIHLADGDGNETAYDVEDELVHCPGISTFDLHEHPGPVSEVEVVVNTERQLRTYERVDAIALIGVPLAKTGAN